MDNTTTIGTAIAGSAPFDWKLAGTGDFNKDGKDDLLWQNTATGQVGYWYTDNTNILSSAIVGSALGWNLL